MNSIPMPEITSAFTVDDIHKIREWNYERRKGMSNQEIILDTEQGADEFEKLIIASRERISKTK